MRDIALPLQDFLQSMNEDAARAYYIKKLYDAFARAVLDVYGQFAACLVLSNVQAVYLMDDEGAFKGDQVPPRILRIYTSDPVVRADLDARQEFIKMNLAKQGYQADGFKLHASTFGMKERAPFAQLVKDLKAGGSLTAFASDEGSYDQAAQELMQKNLQVVKVSLCQVFGQDADTVVKGINAAYVTPMGNCAHLVILYAQQDALASLLRQQSDVLCARMRDLGLMAARLDIRRAESWMEGKQAFPALSAPVVVKRP